MSDRARLVRWRLVPGESATEALGCELSAGEQAQDRALGFLYDRTTTARWRNASSLWAPTSAR